MIQTCLKIVTEVGVFDMPDDMAVIYATSKFRKDGQPDRRFRSGKVLAEKFAAFRDDRLREYIAGETINGRRRASD